MKFAVVVALLMASAPLAAQSPPVGIVDVYGARTITSAQIRAAAKIAVGDAVTDRTEVDAEARLRAFVPER